MMKLGRTVKTSREVLAASPEVLREHPTYQIKLTQHFLTIECSQSSVAEVLVGAAAIVVNTIAFSVSMV